MRHDVERLATSLGARLRCWAALPELLAGIDAQAIGALVLEVDRGPMSAPSRLCARHRWICRFPAGLLVNIVVDNSVDRA